MMKKSPNPLPKEAHGTISHGTTTAHSKHTIKSGEQYVKKPINAHNHQPGFKGKVA